LDRKKNPLLSDQKKKGKKEGKKRKDQPSLFQLNTDLESAWLNWNNLSLSLSLFFFPHSCFALL